MVQFVTGTTQLVTIKLVTQPGRRYEVITTATVKAKGSRQEIRGRESFFRGLNEYTLPGNFNSERQVETGAKYISGIGPLTAAGGVSLPGPSCTEM